MQSKSLPRQGSMMRGLCRAPTNVVPSVALRKVWAAVASPETMKPMKMKKDKCAKDALYLFQWHRPSQGTTDARQLCDQLKTLEKVSKDAVWFTVKEAPTGGQHVLVVTADSKAARKYSLTELTEPVVSLSLEGMPEPVEVPVATLKASLEAMMEDSSSSDSSEDDEPMIMKPKDKKKDEKKKKMKVEMPVTVEEGPAAALEAASLMRAVAGGSEGGHIEPMVVGGGVQMERKKLKDAVKEMDAIPQAGTVLVKAMDDDESSSSGSSSCSEDECDKDQGMKVEQGMKVAKMEMGKKGKDESSESESSGSESDEECEKGKGKVEVIQPVIVS